MKRVLTTRVGVRSGRRVVSGNRYRAGSCFSFNSNRSTTCFVRPTPKLYFYEYSSTTNTTSSAEATTEAPLKKKIDTDLKTAMLARDKKKTAVLRLMKAELHNSQIDLGRTLKDEDCIKAFQKMIAATKEAITSHEQQGYTEGIEKANEEIQMINEYLPQQLTPEELKAAITSAIQESGATAISDTKKIMAILNQKEAGRFNSKEVGAIVRDLLKK